MWGRQGDGRKGEDRAQNEHEPARGDGDEVALSGRGPITYSKHETLLRCFARADGLVRSPELGERAGRRSLWEPEVDTGWHWTTSGFSLVAGRRALRGLKSSVWITSFVFHT